MNPTSCMTQRCWSDRVRVEYKVELISSYVGIALVRIGGKCVYGLTGIELTNPTTQPLRLKSFSGGHPKLKSFSEAI